MQIQPYVFFDGRCDEAIAFYREALGAEVVSLMRYGEGPQSPAPGTADKVMHAELRIGEATVLVSDGHCGGQARFEGFALSLTVTTEPEAEQRFAALGDGGEVSVPLGPTFFSPRFGMVTDRFGVLWIVYVAA
jgi:PhnB protein